LKKIQIISVVGARPNFIKVAPIIKELNIAGIENILVHTGQHYDKNMSDSFFSDLELPEPDIFMAIGSGSHAEQTGKIMIEFEKICKKISPKLVIVAGDVNSTLACSIVAAKCHISLAHVEAGLRSNDLTMPEEINRILTDRVSDILFVTEKSGINNLKNEGISPKKIHFVGNCMIDSLITFLPKANNTMPWEKYDLKINDYMVVTLHRPSNVDKKDRLKNILQLLNALSNRIKFIFPVHPRTQKVIENFNLDFSTNFNLVNPLPYIEFIGLMSKSLGVITDSGGIQEETTYMGVKCITLRENTERPITVEIGTNVLIGDDISKLNQIINDLNKEKLHDKKIPEKWDGSASERIVKIIAKYLEK